MKPIRFAAFILYRYYSTGKRPDRSPYFRTLCTLSMFAFVHLIQLLLIYKKLNKSSPIRLVVTDLQFFILTALTVVMFFILRRLVPQSKLNDMLDEYAYSWDKIFYWRFWLIGYAIVSFFLIFVLAVW